MWAHRVFVIVVARLDFNEKNQQEKETRTPASINSDNKKNQLRETVSGGVNGEDKYGSS